MDAHLSSKEAAALLGVKLPTLYAYASRGLLRSIPGESGRARFYLRADVDRLRERRDAKRNPGPAAASALRWGAPVLDSSITRMSDAGPVYRGHPALELASGGAAFESVAELLWTGNLPNATPRWPAQGAGVSTRRLAELLPADPAPLACLALTLPALAAADPGRFDTNPEARLERARVLIPRLAASLALGSRAASVDDALAAGRVARVLATAIGAPTTPGAVALIEMTLVLLADHELNSSAFAARVAASTGADLYACLSAGVATLTGPQHGGASERVEAMVREAGAPEHAERTVHERMRRGELVPGFGHLIYRHGDPRTAPLLAAAGALAPTSRTIRTIDAIVEAMRAAGRPAPNVDLAIVAVTGALGLGPGRGPALFGIARCAGWVAHVMEQYTAGFLVRPRARYLGVE